MARDCKKSRHTKRNMLLAEIGVQGRPTDKVNPSIGSVNAVDSKNGTATDCISMQSDISNGGKLLFLVDTGSDISLLKPYKLDKTKQFDPEGRVKVKGVNGSTFQTLGTVQAVPYEGSVRTQFIFQLADKQVDHPCDGILGRDFLAHKGAKICYETGTSTLGTGNTKIHMPMNAKGQPKGVWRPVLPGRAKIVVRLPVEGTIDEGLTEKQEIREGVYLAGAITKVQAGYAITSIVNTTNETMEIDEPILRVAEVGGL